MHSALLTSRRRLAIPTRIPNITVVIIFMKVLTKILKINQ
jgi:hypothetical protein